MPIYKIHCMNLQHTDILGGMSSEEVEEVARKKWSFFFQPTPRPLVTAPIGPLPPDAFFFRLPSLSPHLAVRTPETLTGINRVGGRLIGRYAPSICHPRRVPATAADPRCSPYRSASLAPFSIDFRWDASADLGWSESGGRTMTDNT